MADEGGSAETERRVGRICEVGTPSLLHSSTGYLRACLRSRPPRQHPLFSKTSPQSSSPSSSIFSLRIEPGRGYRRSRSRVDDGSVVRSLQVSPEISGWPRAFSLSGVVRRQKDGLYVRIGLSRSFPLCIDPTLSLTPFPLLLPLGVHFPPKRLQAPFPTRSLSATCIRAPSKFAGYSTFLPFQRTQPVPRPSRHSSPTLSLATAKVSRPSPPSILLCSGNSFSCWI
jgi:hypothetical protein